MTLGSKYNSVFLKTGVKKNFFPTHHCTKKCHLWYLSGTKISNFFLEIFQQISKLPQNTLWTP